MKPIAFQCHSYADRLALGNDEFIVPALVSMPDVPYYLGHVSRSKVYGLVASGELTRVRIGGRAFISGESIAAFLGKVLADGGAE